MRRFAAVTILIIAFHAIGTINSARADEKNPAPKQIQFFETRIRPVLAKHCFRCHGPKRQRGDLRLDSQLAMKKGGVSGGSVINFDAPEKSLLVQAIRHEKVDLKMPPSKKLTDQQIADLTAWVKLGAFFPKAVKVAKEETSGHWAFQAPVKPELPDVKNPRWPTSPIDHFILAILESKAVTPAPRADRRTLIRRATFDLTGLPPTPAEIDAFLADKSKDAFAKVVDRLLASQHYGERWGRHWLDVARYADSNGLDENIAFGNAWRYRDYVVASFNADKSYDRFLMEQIAGDLLPAKDHGERVENLIATGFLAMGPKVLAEPDEKKMEMDILDEQIDTLGRSVMALTMGCARCHNHKFDPILMRDYYGLVGIFQSTKTMEHFKKIARWHENSIAGTDDLAEKKKHDAEVVRKEAVINGIIREAEAKIKADAKPGMKLPKKLEPLYPKPIQAELKRLRDELTAFKKSAPELPTAMGVVENKTADAKLLRRGDHLQIGETVPRHFPVFLTDETQPSLPPTQSGRLQLAKWLTHRDHPLTSRVMVNRIWRWHFGRGLVGSTDNFGVLGDRPSHPALLDWLAVRFMNDGWSMKKMHRLIMLSSTYQMSSAHNEECAKIDPENILLWRANVRRLESEAIRDSVLAVSGMLDRKMGGSMLHVENRKFFFDHTSKDMTKYDSPRRAIYLPVVRNNLYDVFQLFDSTDAAVSSGNRATTTVATQALFMLNSDLVMDAASRLADGVLTKKGLDDVGRIRLLYQEAYGRLPSEREIARDTAAIAKIERALRDQVDSVQQRRLAWAYFCHTIIAANEFLYVR